MIFVKPDCLPNPDKSELTHLQRMADEVMNYKAVSVTDFARPDIAPRNYYSIGRYYHPNPETPDGLPWISSDGIANPNADNGPKQTMREIIKNVLILSAAGYFVDKKYARRAIELLNKWFLDTESGMNPNLDNAQIVPGLNTGRPAGIIDSHIWINIILATDFLDNKEFLNKMQNWFGKYADWLACSAPGIAARDIGNNISAWYAAQLIVFAGFAGNRDEYILQCINMFKWFLSNKMNASGCFDGELRRTRSLHYCLFHLNAMAIIAEAAYHTGTDLWHWRDSTGKSLEDAFDFLMPVIAGDCDWPYQQIITEKFPRQFSFYLASIRYGRPEFACINNKLSRDAGFVDIMGPQYLWPGLI